MAVSKSVSVKARKSAVEKRSKVNAIAIAPKQSRTGNHVTRLMALDPFTVAYADGWLPRDLVDR